MSDLAAVVQSDHARATYAATGGARVTSSEVAALGEQLRVIAHDFGYPEATDDSRRIGYDRAAAEALFERMDLTTVEAAHNGVWNFLTFVVAPDLVRWRWLGSSNPERWICTDRTRHMFARLWWQALTFGQAGLGVPIDLSLLRALDESDLNQITERRAIAGNPRLAQAVARLAMSAEGATRRTVLRDLTPRLRRRLAFVDFAALTDQQIEEHLRSLKGGKT
ncbi:DUF6339 family protein [Sporichthya sp.]|uniref:DUF6339 family protein n=1 Tax=Sporichthya sp. TaxID=65475 RepID=UPI00182B32E7|nr:DUF6339 family protein [Sporichthya sp.]MBA3744499.1 hypothetical protein [Sporichthya sp.]